MDRMQGRGSLGIWTLSGAVAASSLVVASSLVAATWLVVALPAGADEHEHDHASAGGTVVQVVTTNIQGKNVFIPSTIAIKEGEEVTLSIFNTTDTPHGFRISELGIETLLMPGEETEVKLPKVEEEGLHRIDCQLHPAHRRATLLVVE
jgi:heme/copper-type cytochrome/quinol oxidase subunit 2